MHIAVGGIDKAGVDIVDMIGGADECFVAAEICPIASTGGINA